MKLKLDPRNKLHNARRVLSLVGINIEVDSLAQKATLNQIRELEDLGPDEAAQLVEVVQHMNAFDELVSRNLNQMNVGERYEDIRENFESIIKDLERKVRGASGSRNLFDKIQDKLISWKRGDVKERFQKIKVSYESVFGDADKQIEHETAILEAYRDYREALRDSSTIAEVLKKRAQEAYTEVKGNFVAANDEVDNAPADLDPLELAALKIKRDDLQRELEKLDRRQDIASSLAEKLQVSFGISEAVMTRYAETTKVRDNVQRQSAMFYTANSGVMTVLAATFMQLEATNEQSQVLSEMGKQTSAMLNKLSQSGQSLNKIAKNATEAAYTSYISAEDIRKLYESTVEFKAEQNKMVKTLREARDKNMEAVRIEIDKGQRLLAQSQVEEIGIAKKSTSTPKAMAVELEIPEASASRIAQKRNEEQLPRGLAAARARARTP